jgi:hypothetical protein
MGKTVTIEDIHRELKLLKEDMEILKHILVPEEKIPIEELEEIKKIKEEMESGKEKRFDEVFAK